MPHRVAICALALVLSSAEAASPAAEKAEARREEAAERVRQIIAGVRPSAAVNRIKYLGEEPFAVEALASALRQSTELTQRRELVSAIASLEVRAAEPVLVELLADPDASIRMAAVAGLRRLGSQQVERIAPLLEDRTVGVRVEAAKALGASGRKDAGPSLAAAAAAEGRPEARVVMLVAIGQTGDRRQIDRLTRFLKSSSEATRWAAARALCLLGSPHGFAWARSLLASKEPSSRRSALSLLEGLGSPDAKAALLPLVEDPDPRVAASAARILYQAGEKTMLERLVRAWFASEGEARRAYEGELEALRVSLAQRQEILEARPHPVSEGR